MTRDPLVSVVMPVFNGERYLRSSIESILSQTWRDFEFIIVDDGSTDATTGIVREYDDKRILLIRNSMNLGIAASLNKGIERSKGELVARMDADDRTYRRRFEKQILYLKHHPAVVVLGTGFTLVTADGQRVRRVNMPHSDPEIRWRLLFNPAHTLCHPSVMIRRSYLNAVHNYCESESVQYVEDYDLWTRLTRREGQFANLREPLLYYRRDELSPFFEVKWAKQQRESVEISRRNLEWLMEDDPLTSVEFQRVSDFWSGAGIDLSIEAISQALEVLNRIFEAFADRQHLALSERKAFERSVFRQIASRIRWLANWKTYHNDFSTAANLLFLAEQRDKLGMLTPGALRLRLKLKLGKNRVETIRKLRAACVSEGRGQL
jgi:glycosyltransferase involved in cell wall biosynthesis